MNFGIEFGIYEIVSIVVVLLTLLGIRLLGSPRTAVAGNRIGALAMLGAILVVLVHNGILDVALVIGGLAAGCCVGVFLAAKVTMLRMPQLVALLNGFGGLASLLVAVVVVIEQFDGLDVVNLVAGQLAILVGGVTFSGSMIAAAKLDKRMDQKPVVLPGHSVISAVILAIMVAVAAASPFAGRTETHVLTAVASIASLAFGVIFAIRIGGADMPVTISLLNSYSGVAASICGFALGDYLLIAIGAIVGAAGLILTRIMCRAMNRSLVDILTGRTAYTKGADIRQPERAAAPVAETRSEEAPEARWERIVNMLKAAKTVIVVPGYGMALSQAQAKVKELYDILAGQGKEVRFAIHPVAGRMPGHMNVLLAEVDIPYEKLFELEDINPMFRETDVAVIVGACDVVNPEAITAQGTPIYGMPILHVHEAKNVVVFNLDTKPGYSGVENSLYAKDNVVMSLGNAEETLGEILGGIR
ncbi:MAG: NAD(P)(+) transhydrogenase (Re/Si-specific) subunit beta [Spirochaetes bacterium]|nr:NAD(P)(+) transhydrogenase (Re/Si-specific) subunit beta [Spirochaetota bacterium]